jgi:hypothetical protein
MMLNPRSKNVLTLIAGVAVLGGVAWGVGWLAHDLLDRQAEPLATVTATVEPTVVSTPTPTSTAPAPTDALPSPPTDTLRPTSTLAPTLIPTPTESWITVGFEEGLYQICRRHCPGQWPGDDVPPGLEEYAREVARVNGLRWGIWGPRLKVGQVLDMPPCPSAR